MDFWVGVAFAVVPALLFIVFDLLDRYTTLFKTNDEDESPVEQRQNR